MARRPRPPDEVLSRKDLAELQRRLSMMGQTAVQDFYQSAHMVCRIGPGHFPSARAIQELVQAWKQKEVALRLDYSTLAFAGKPRIEDCDPSYGERYLA